MQPARRAIAPWPTPRAIGGATGGLLETTFAEETETDLFGEQAVLCGGAKELVMAGYQTLVDAGYQPEVAYFECMHELKLIVDLFYEGGISKMHDFISETAKYGAVASGPRIITDETRARMREVLNEIQSGKFARDWIVENEAGKPRYNAMLKADRDHPIEKTGAELRERMAWLKPTDERLSHMTKRRHPPRRTPRRERSHPQTGARLRRRSAGAAGRRGRVRLSGRRHHAGL